MAAYAQAAPASEPRRASRNLARADAIGRPVGEVMIRRPKTLSVSCTVAELRAQFDNPHVRVALFVDGERFTGLAYPDDVPMSALPSAAGATYARRDAPSIGADADVADALALMDSRGERRLVVLGPGGLLSGLLCLDKTGLGFCRDRAR